MKPLLGNHAAKGELRQRRQVFQSWPLLGSHAAKGKRRQRHRLRSNPADIFTKVVARALLDRHLGRMVLVSRREAGRAASAPLVAAQVDKRLAAK